MPQFCRFVHYKQWFPVEKKINYLYFYREMYENSIAKCRKTLEEYRTKYKESALAQEYYKKKEEVEEIQKRALEWLKKYKWKEDTSLDALGTAIANAFTMCTAH